MCLALRPFVINELPYRVMRGPGLITNTSHYLDSLAVGSSGGLGMWAAASSFCVEVSAASEVPADDVFFFKGCERPVCLSMAVSLIGSCYFLLVLFFRGQSPAPVLLWVTSPSFSPPIRSSQSLPPAAGLSKPSVIGRY